LQVCGGKGHSQQHKGSLGVEGKEFNQGCCASQNGGGKKGKKAIGDRGKSASLFTKVARKLGWEDSSLRTIDKPTSDLMEINISRNKILSLGRWGGVGGTLLGVRLQMH